MTSSDPKRELCISCRSPQTVTTCPLCKEPICKNCVQNLDEGAFALQSTRSAELSHREYCAFCWDQHVAPALERYDALLAQAREVYFFFNTQKKHYPLIRKAKRPVQVENCPDRDETILRLGFLAAEQGYNAIVGGEVKSKKIRNAGYQTSAWFGTGTPALVNAEQLAKQQD